MTGELSQGIESKLIKSGLTPKKGRNKKKKAKESEVWLEMYYHFCSSLGWVRCLVCWSQAGHLHWRLAHKSCLMAERTDTASILAPTKPPRFMWAISVIHDTNRTKFSQSGGSRYMELGRGEGAAVATDSLTKWNFGRTSPAFNPSLRRRGQLLPSAVCLLQRLWYK